MSQNTHQLGVSEINLVHRHLKLNYIDDEQLELAMNEINKSTSWFG